MALNERLAALVEKYVQSLPERWTAINRPFQTLCELCSGGSLGLPADTAEKALAAAREVLHGTHKLAGSAGSMGFYPLGHAAGTLEVMLDGLIQHQKLFSSASLAQLRLLHQNLYQHLHGLTATDSSLGADSEQQGWHEDGAALRPLTEAPPRPVLLLLEDSQPGQTPVPPAEADALAGRLAPFAVPVHTLAPSGELTVQTLLDPDMLMKLAEATLLVVHQHHVAAFLELFAIASEHEERHALLSSSESACLAGIKAIARVPLLVTGNDLSLKARTTVARLSVRMAACDRISPSHPGALPPPPAPGNSYAMLVASETSAITAAALDMINTSSMYQPSLPMRLLMVDDDDLLLSVCDHLFTSGGFDFRGFLTPEHLLEEISAHQPDVIILDRRLQQWDGFEVAMAIRQIPAWANLPVLFLTAEGSSLARQEALAAGGDGFLSASLLIPCIWCRLSVPAYSGPDKTGRPWQQTA